MMKKCQQPTLTRQSLIDTVCPFLYHTHTIQCPRSTSRAFTRTAFRQKGAPSTALKVKHDVGQVGFLQRKAQEVKQRQQPIESTITSAEREIFENIRRKFGGKIEGILPTKGHSRSQAAKEHDLQAQSSLQSLALATNSTNHYNTNINHILSLLTPAVVSPPESDHYEPFQTPSEVETPIDPPNPLALNREAALRALKHINSSITTSLQSASSPPDLAIWQTLESELFPLISFLQQPSSVTRVSSEIHRLQQLTIADIQPPHPRPLTDLPTNTPLLPLITILYPAATLLALRTYAAHLPASGFLLALLPRLRALGPTSYLLAGTTPFFNTLLQLQWDVYSDFKAIDELLGQMRRDGVDFDQGTLHVLERIRHDQQAEISSDNPQNSRGKQWWDMQLRQISCGRVCGKYWKKEIIKDIERRTASVSEEGEQNTHTLIT